VKVSQEVRAGIPYGYCEHKDVSSDCEWMALTKERVKNEEGFRM
jgi:hypothetical protein